MPNNKYLIVGGRMTSAAAITGIREIDDQGSIGVLTAEPHPPYNRDAVYRFEKPLLTVNHIDSGRERTIVANRVIAGIGVEPKRRIGARRGALSNDHS